MQNVNTDQLNDFIDKENDLLLIDVLSEDHYAKEHIPGAVNIPYESPNFVNTVEATAGRKDRPIIVYCANSDCPLSAKASKALESAGFNNVRDYEAGIETWSEQGQQTVSA